MNDILPHMKGGPVLACFGLSDAPRLDAAIRSVVKKYPNITLACFDSECYNIVRQNRLAHVLFSPFMAKDVIEKYNVIGALAGVGYDGNTCGLKEMRI